MREFKFKFKKKEAPHFERTQQPTSESQGVSLCAKASKHIGGILCLVVLVIDWVCYGEMMQAFKDGSYNQLYFIRYCCTSGYMLVIIPWFFLHRYGVKKIKHQQLLSDLMEKSPQDFRFNAKNSISAGSAPYSLAVNSVNNHGHNADIIDIEATYQQSTFTFLRSMTSGIMFVGAVAFFCGYFWYLSLDHTIVAANNTIYQSQCVFVLLFSAFILKTKITLMKMVAMLLAVGGVAMVSFGIRKESDNNVKTTWFGYVLCLISTIFYAMQAVGTKYVGDKHFRRHFEMADTFLLMAGMGMFVFLCLWPGFIILHFLGIEKFSLPHSYDDVMTIVLPTILDCIFVGSYMTGITLSGPVLMSLGALSIIPVSFVVDAWLHGLEITIFAIIGSFLIFISFIVIEIPTNKLITCTTRTRGIF